MASETNVVKTANVTKYFMDQVNHSTAEHYTQVEERETWSHSEKRGAGAHNGSREFSGR